MKTMTITTNTLKKDKQLLVLTHLSQLLDYVTGFGGLIVPLVLWLIKKDEITDMDKTGKVILNFQLSMFLYAIICVPLILLFGLGFLGLIGIAIISFVFPISNAIRVSNDKEPNYPFSIAFIK